MEKKTFRGSLTVEMAYIAPLIMLVFYTSVMGIFYYHDKNVIAACTYETAVVGGTKAREKRGVSESLLQEAFRERVQGKCILFSAPEAHISVDEDAITVTASASKGRMRVNTSHTASITKPETYIRKMQKIKEMGGQ